MTEPKQNDSYPLPHPRVRDLPERHRPRELFDRLGAEHVPEEVLLAIVLRSGVEGMSVIALAEQLLTRYGSLVEMARAPTQDLAQLKGLGKVKAQVLKAALQLGSRMAAELAPKQASVRTPEDAVALLREEARLRETEAFWVLLLDTRNRLKRPPKEISSGLLDASLVHPREVFAEAVRTAAAAVVLAHNHPSGDPTPSAEDIKVTRQLVEAGRIVDIQVLDHVIIGKDDGVRDSEFCSLRESGLVDFG